MLALRDRRDGALWEYAPGQGPGAHRYRLSPHGRDHYVRHWACYGDLYPEIDAPAPRAGDGAHTGIGDHFTRKPKGLLTAPQWRLLAALATVDASGTCPTRRVIEGQYQQRRQSVPDLTGLPNGLMDWYIAKHITPSRTAAAKLIEGGFAAYTDISGFQRHWHTGPREPVAMLHITDAGRAHAIDHLATYQQHYPDIDTALDNARQARP
jgi:hypothetical protein